MRQSITKSSADIEMAFSFAILKQKNDIILSAVKNWSPDMGK